MMLEEAEDAALIWVAPKSMELGVFNLIKAMEKYMQLNEDEDCWLTWKMYYKSLNN